MPSILAVTLGNCNLKMAIATREARAFYLGTPVQFPIEEIRESRPKLARILSEGNGEAMPMVVASVNPPALDGFLRLARQVSRRKVLVAGQDFLIPIRTKVHEPDGVGVDRLLAALAAYRRAQKECVVVDLGTAATVNAVRRDGTFLGGVIFPGLRMMARALAQGTAQLAEVSLDEAAGSIGKTTQEAIRAGILHGTSAAIEGLIRDARWIVGSRAPVFVTGGDVMNIFPYVTDRFRNWCRYPDLVLEGLGIAYFERQDQ